MPHEGMGAVLLYHRIATLASDPWRLAVEPPRFAEQLEVLTSVCHPLPLSDLVQAVREGEVRSGSVSITFDDGYRDTLYEAKPLLERYGVPATVFVVSGYVGSGRNFWWDVLERLCRTMADGHEFDALYRAWHSKLQALDDEERQMLLESKRAEIGSPPATTVDTITTTELKSLADSALIEVGAHTVTHPVLTHLDRSAQLEEMRSSRRQLEGILGRSVDCLSYPFGSYGRESVACARDAGFGCACTSIAGPVTANTSLLELPRFRVENWSGNELGRRLSGWLAKS